MLNEKQAKCLNLMVTTNKAQKEIAQEINVTEKTICEWKKDSEFKIAIKRLINCNFNLLSLKAQQRLDKLLDSDNEYIQLQTAKDILNRNGFVYKEKIFDLADNFDIFGD